MECMEAEKMPSSIRNAEVQHETNRHAINQVTNYLEVTT